VFARRPGETFGGTLVVNQLGSIQDTSFIYQRGEFYLDISASNTNWQIKVEAKY
jgi:hypothetical protein